MQGDVLESADYAMAECITDMVRDYETPTVPRTWETMARRLAERLGLHDKEVSLICSPDRYGIAIVLRLIRNDGIVCTSTRRGSEADDAAERRQNFLAAVTDGDYRTIEIDVAGYFVGEGLVPCPYCGGAPHEEWQHAIARELLRIAAPPTVDENLAPDDADDAEREALDAAVFQLLAEG